MYAEDLIVFLEDNCVIVTATERLSRELRIKYAIAMKESGKTSWATPNIFSLPRFIQSLWLDSWPSEQLVHPVQEQYLIFQSVAKSENHRLLNAKPTAKLIQKAVQICKQYNIDINDNVFDANEEHSAFREWFAKLEDKKKFNKWLSQYELSNELKANVIDSQVTLPECIGFVGFVDKQPSLTSLVDTLESTGVAIRWFDDFHNPASVHPGVRPETRQQEVEDIALAMKSVLSDYAENISEAPTFAVVLPETSSYRELIEQVFSRHLAPHLLWPNDQVQAKPWQFSTGEPLATNEAIDTALRILQLQPCGNDLDDITNLLLNVRVGRYIGKENSRAFIDYKLRKSGLRKVSLSFLAKVSGPDVNGESIDEDFSDRVTCLSTSLENNRSEHPSVWVKRFAERLDCFGWPGKLTQSSESYQAIEAWNNQLVIFSGMDSSVGAVSYWDAMSLLVDLVTAHVFMPRRNYKSPIQIMEIWDVAGYQYDHAYVLGLSSKVLPRQAAPNPFIPYDLQKAAGVPGCCPEIELSHSKALLSYIQGLAPEVLYSCPMYSDEGHLLTPSTLVSGWSNEPLQRELSTDEPLVLETREEVIPPILDIEAEAIRGGVSILGGYAREPFFAFAANRLKVEEFPVPEDGLDARVQGELLHYAMQVFWEKHKSKSKLDSLSDGDLGVEISLAVADALHNPKILPPGKLPMRLCKLEEVRLRRLMTRWLNYEKQRVHDFEVIACEIPVEGYVGKLKVKLRIDRIDRVFTPDGDKHIVLDYKSGQSVSATGWNPDALTEPQLPIYVTSADLSELGINELDGIGFAQIADGSCLAHICTNWTGDLVNSKSRSKPVDNWPKQLQDWTTQLESNVNGFFDGRACVDYATYKNHSFYYGHLFPLVGSPSMLDAS